MLFQKHVVRTNLDTYVSKRENMKTFDHKNNDFLIKMIY